MATTGWPPPVGRNQRQRLDQRPIEARLTPATRKSGHWLSKLLKSRSACFDKLSKRRHLRGAEGSLPSIPSVGPLHGAGMPKGCLWLFHRAFRLLAVILRLLLKILARYLVRAPEFFWDPQPQGLSIEFEPAF